MRRSTLLSRFLGDYAPGALPPRGPDGMVPAPPPPAGPAVEPPSLCEAGPCANYHRLVSVMDSADGLSARGALHVQITRACYPAPGIEVDLGETPVMQCSHWEPADGRHEDTRKAFLRTPAGERFAAAAAAFEAATGITDTEED